MLYRHKSQQKRSYKDSQVKHPRIVANAFSQSERRYYRLKVEHLKSQVESTPEGRFLSTSSMQGVRAGGYTHEVRAKFGSSGTISAHVHILIGRTYSPG